MRTLTALPASLGDDHELAFRVGDALANRRIEDVGALARVRALRPSIESATAKSGGWKKSLAALNDHGDDVVASRKQLFVAADPAHPA